MLFSAVQGSHSLDFQSQTNMSLALEQAKSLVSDKALLCLHGLMLWRTDKKIASLVYRCHDLAGDLSEVFDSLTNLHCSFVDDVADGNSEYSEEFELDLKRIMGQWTVTAKGFMTDVLNPLKQDGHQIAGYEQLADQLAVAEESRTVDFDNYAIEKLRSIELPIAAITSTFDRTKLGKFDVPSIPYAKLPQRSNTGLSKDSIVQCNWVGRVRADELKRIGVMPVAIQLRVKKLVAEFLSREN